MDELYRSDNVVVRRVMTTDVRRWIITFDNYGIGPGFDRPGFGEAFLRQSGISAIHVMGCGDDWYQYPDMAEATAAVRLAVADADAVMTYGSSMGGYAALRFASAVNATAALALSPQYSLDPLKVPHDRRWLQDAERIRWLPEIDAALSADLRPVIVFDPASLDGWHGLRIAEELSAISIRLRHTAHPVTTYLSEVGLLAPLVVQTLDGTLDGKAFEKTARQQRRMSGTYLGELAMLQPLHRTGTALALARQAVKAAPGAGHANICLSRLLTRQGEHEEAIALLVALVEANRITTHLIHYSDALLAAGYSEKACEITREVLDDSPNNAHVWGWAGYVFWNAGKQDEARAAVKVAVKLAPSNPYFGKLLTNYRFASVDRERPGGARVPLWLRAVRWLGNGHRSTSFTSASPISRPISES